MHIVVHSQIADICAKQWNNLLKDNNPFMRHEFLLGLEESACVCSATGWDVCHIAVYAEQNDHSTLLGALPCYAKTHSYGEYIFDWAWADAHHRHGLDYYPKLSNAVPFTPATGERWLIADNANKDDVQTALINATQDLAAQHDASSFHSLFLNKEQYDSLPNEQFLKRLSTQFHWQNKGYKSFDDFLALMSSKKRKNIKRERRRVAETGIEYQWLSGDELTPEAVETMYSFYKRTIAYYGAQSYLNKPFFDYLADSFSQQTLFLFARFQDQVIAGGLYFKSDNTLYGRYWGALHNFHSVHFETCYYQAIEWCIKNGYQRFEAGAQGEHKLARGLEPSATYSAHWIRHPEFKQAIGKFVEQESAHINQYQDALDKHSPFKQVEI